MELNRRPRSVANLGEWARHCARQLVSRPRFRALREETRLYTSLAAAREHSGPKKSLFATALQRPAHRVMARLVQKFGHENFDFIFFLWDGAEFDQDDFAGCRMISEPGYKWQFFKKYVTPEVCADYEYIFAWDDDIGVDLFSVGDFLDVMRRNHLQMAQPALTRSSFYSHSITLQHATPVGRYTDFVEIMVPVFEVAAWSRFYEIIEPANRWGWGYDRLARSLCGFSNLGIVDCQPVRHLKPVVSKKVPGIYDAMADLLAQHPRSQQAGLVSYALLS